MNKCNFCIRSIPTGHVCTWKCGYDGCELEREKSCDEAIKTMLKYADARDNKNIDKQENITRKNEKVIRDLAVGEHFKFKNFEWIVLDNNVDSGILAIMASVWNEKEYSFDNDGCNNYAKSSLRRKLLNELLPVLGKYNLIPHEVDLVADNGDDRYGTVTDRVFILSCDEYRKYRKHVPLLSEWMWTCTPWYITDAGHSDLVRFVYSTGYLDSGIAYNSYGVAPACVFKPYTIIDIKEEMEK